MSVDNNSDRYLKAFAAIEKHLKNKSRLDRRSTFYELINEASKEMPEVKQYRDDLKEFGDLRNAIVHERTDGHVIAEPNLNAVESLEKIKNVILKPPKVLHLFRRTVLIFEVKDPIGSAVKIMTEKSFSQIPIFNNGKFKALLTNNTISRWLGTNVEEEIVSLQDTSIGEVLKFTEDRDNFHFIDKLSTVFEVLDDFNEFELKGKKLEALLITDSGKQNEKIIGIITVSDLTRLLKIIA